MVIHYTERHTSEFLIFLNELSEEERNHVIEFMADKENLDAVKEYQVIIEKLKTLKKNKLVEQFELARQQRKALQDH